MAKLLDMPKLSPTMEEGQLAAWHKKVGESVDIDDLLAEVETDKATMEFRSFDRGTLLKILVPAGSIVKLGQPVAILGNAGEDISALEKQAGGAQGGAASESTSKPEAATPPARGAASEPQRPAAQAQAATLEAQRPAAQARDASPQAGPAGPTVASGAAPKGGAGVVAGQQNAQQQTGDQQSAASREEPAQNDNAASEDGRVRASPYVRKLARERDIDLRGVEGSGPGGRVVARDVADMPASGGAAKPARTTASTQGAAGLSEPRVEPLSMMRKAIARRLTESKQTVPHFYLTIDVNASPLATLREQINAELASGESGEKVSFNDLIVKACATALARVPECNAQFTPDALLFHTRVDISVAVAVAEGLVTPVVRDADKKGVLAIAREVRELAGRAKAKKLSPEEMSNGTFSISNLGMFGIDQFAAVINPPEGAILAVGRVRDEPVVENGAVVAGKRLAMTLSCDHRVVDGAVGARFLAELRRLVEQPMRVLLG